VRFVVDDWGDGKELGAQRGEKGTKAMGKNAKASRLA